MSEHEFTVKDRRHFSEDGTPVKDENTDESRRVDSDKQVDDQKTHPGKSEGEKACREQPPLPEVNFSTFVFSLSTSALIHLGEIAEPSSRQICRNLPLAKQTIDILGMLKKKTTGNLDSEEDNLLTNLLYELRMKYVAAVKA